MALGPVDPLFSKFFQHPLLYGSSGLGCLAAARRLSAWLYRAALRVIREKVPEVHGAVCDARIKMAENRRRLDKAAMLGE
jgi:hypothetical protein